MVTPPYYGVTYTGQRGSKKKQYIVDHESLIYWMTQHVYKPSLKVEVSYDHPEPTNPYKETTSHFTVTGKEYDGLVTRVIQIGELIDNLASELVIDPMVLEMLTYITHYLEPGMMNVDHVKELLNVDKVIYDDIGHILVLSVGRDDFTIPLYRVRERLYEELLPILNTLNWKKLGIYITSLNHPAFNKTPMTIGQFYKVLKNFDNLFHIKQFKGLGGMDPKDCYTTCMDPAHRTVYPITTLSDVGEMYKLLGKDSDSRKRLLAGQTQAR